ncbi:MAG: hypothetical protein M3Q07_08715 [Pseudobdellovibrionaceae bacterium]|nr:hypothetical protein [Pseudobdellovibrionaceae bacterium]
MKSKQNLLFVITIVPAVAGLGYLGYRSFGARSVDDAAPPIEAVEPLPPMFSREDQGFVECPEDLSEDDEAGSELIQSPQGTYCIADLLPWGVAPGPFQPDSSLDSLQKVCGDVFADFLFYHGEGQCQWGTAMFHGTSREIQIAWNNWTDKKQPAALRFVGSDLHFAQGVKPGMLVKDLAQINGRPLTLAGFGWAESGVHRSFQGGTLQMFDDPNTPYLIHFGLDWELFDSASEDEHASVIVGESDLESTTPALEKFKAQVEYIEYRFPSGLASQPLTP